MDVKKSFRADLKNKRGLLLGIGLVVTLGLVIVAFNYILGEYRIQKIVQIANPVAVDMAPVTWESTDEPRKVQANTVSDGVWVLNNDSMIFMDNWVLDSDGKVVMYDSFDGIYGNKVENIDDPDCVYLFAETMPSFQGGDLNTFRTWVQQNVRFPQIALENGIQGRVVVSFVVEKDGRITGIEVLQAPDRSLADEAVRVLNKSPKWSPGKHRNRTVRIKHTLPVDFRVQN